LDDGAGHSRTYTLTLSVIVSSPPVYTNPSVSYSPVTVALNDSINVPIFSNYDPEGLAVVVLC
jgi:hypothetical protein